MKHVVVRSKPKECDEKEWGEDFDSFYGNGMDVEVLVNGKKMSEKTKAIKMKGERNKHLVRYWTTPSPMGPRYFIQNISDHDICISENVHGKPIMVGKGKGAILSPGNYCYCNIQPWELRSEK